MTDRTGKIGFGVLVAAGGALAVYAVWAFAQVDAVVRAARDAGQLGEGTELDVASYYMSSSGLYAVCALALGAIGWLVLRTAPRASAVVPAPAGNSSNPPDRVSSDDELDDLFESSP